MSIANQIRYIKCFLCGHRVRLNGVGSDSTPLNSFLRKVFQFTFFFTAKAFRDAADVHDLIVHQGPQKESFEDYVKRVDLVFRNKCYEIANKYSFFQRLYLLKKADELHACLVFNGGKGYPKEPCSRDGKCIDRDGMDIVSMLKEHKSKKAA